MNKFEIKDTMYLNEEPFKIISGAIHYFRVMPEYWQDRLEKCKAMGCNTVETYIPWNIHEPYEGTYHFEGRLDIERFIQLAQALGLYVIIRPSPYICAEWEFGGLPWWLLKNPTMRLRSTDPAFLDAVDAYYRVLLPKITPYQIDKGGPVILMQVENEYGYYANDTSYMEAMRDLMLKHGVTVPLVTSDGPFYDSLKGGSIKGVLPTGNFGSRTEERFKVLEKHTEGGPLMCTEFWVGWFDHWGNGGHMTGKLEESTKDFDKMVELGHVNIYMFQGGTNFGFMNGSNYYGRLMPDVTSYDYDAVLTEDGQLTEKFHRYREVMTKYNALPELTFSTTIKRKSYGRHDVANQVGLFAVLEDLTSPITETYTQSMEKLDQGYGYILYRTTLSTEERLEKIRLWEANDRAHLFLDQEHVTTLYDLELLEEHTLDRDINEDAQLDILVENMGRVNFGPLMERQRKGIHHCVQINGHMHLGWEHYTLPLDDISRVDFTKEYKEGVPAFYRFDIDVDEVGDTYIDLEGWGKGCVFVNGFNIGRFWEIGPQKRLYIPGPLLKMGMNDVVIFETEGKTTSYITLMDEPDIG